MTREEQINQEAYRQEKLVDIDVESFIAGTKWADANPKTPWISVKEDLPCNNEFPQISVKDDLPNKKLEDLRNQYIYEKSLLEQYGYTSVTTFEEWIEIKNIKL